MFDYGDFMRDLNKSIIVNNNPELGIFFDTAMKDAIIELNDRIVKNEKKCIELENKKLSAEFEKARVPNELDQIILEKQADCRMHTSWLHESLTAIYEMRIINLYKSFEIEIKQIIKQVYLDINDKDFYRWDMLTNFLKSIGIVVKSISGFNETDQLRVVNNQIKHSGSLQSHVKAIFEFSNSERFSSDNLHLFYKRVYSQVNIFLSNLSSEIYKARYEFSDERLTKIAFEYKERMDNKTIEKLIEKLK